MGAEAPVSPGVSAPVSLSSGFLSVCLVLDNPRDSLSQSLPTSRRVSFCVGFSKPLCVCLCLVCGVPFSAPFHTPPSLRQ